MSTRLTPIAYHLPTPLASNTATEQAKADTDWEEEYSGKDTEDAKLGVWDVFPFLDTLHPRMIRREDRSDSLLSDGIAVYIDRSAVSCEVALWD